MSAGLEFMNVSVDYRDSRGARIRAVSGASLSVGPGEVVGLVGESGCGKSTLARAGVGLVRIAEGEIRFNGKVVKPLSRRSRTRAMSALQMVFQNPYSSLNPRRCIGDQVGDALSIEKSVSKHDRPTRVIELLSRVGLERPDLRRYPREFSGGQRQRIAIARALATSPSVIILDEPLSSLDASGKAQLAILLRSLANDLGVGMLLISHDLSVVREIADRVAVMYLGKIVETTSARLLWTRALHPYSVALLDAIPSVEAVGRLPSGLRGEVPSPASPPTGCRFHPRCDQALAMCATLEPDLTRVAAEQSVACWLHIPRPCSERRTEVQAETNTTCAAAREPLRQTAVRHGPLE